MTRIAHTIAVRGLQAILGSLIVVSVASTVSATRLPSVSSAGPLEPVVRESVAHTYEYFAAIEQRNLFRSTEPQIAAAAALPKSRLKLELIGTVVASGGASNSSVAVVHDSLGLYVTVRAGETFSGGQVRLVSIEPRSIVVEYQGALETVSLETEVAAQPEA